MVKATHGSAGRRSGKEETRQSRVFQFLRAIRASEDVVGDVSALLDAYIRPDGHARIDDGVLLDHEVPDSSALRTWVLEHLALRPIE